MADPITEQSKSKWGKFWGDYPVSQLRMGGNAPDGYIPQIDNPFAESVFQNAQRTGQTTTSLEDALAGMALENYASTKPLRDQFLAQYMDLLMGKKNPMSMPSFAPMFATGKEATEGQYNVARENVLSNAARGGTMDRSLTDVEEARANQMSDLPAMLSQQITDDMLNKASVAAFGAPATSMAGLGSASQTQTSRLNATLMAQAQMDAQRMMAEAQGEAALWGALGGLGGVGLDYALWAA